jgi:exodeoxyribonuclease VII small subunit
MKKKSLAEDPSTPPFEKAIAELETIIQTLESGQLPLQDIITTYERGCHLAAICQAHLQKAQLKIERISQASPSPEPSNPQPPQNPINLN